MKTLMILMFLLVCVLIMIVGIALDDQVFFTGLASIWAFWIAYGLYAPTEPGPLWRSFFLMDKPVVSDSERTFRKTIMNVAVDGLIRKELFWRDGGKVARSFMIRMIMARVNDSKAIARLRLNELPFETLFGSFIQNHEFHFNFLRDHLLTIYNYCPEDPGVFLKEVLMRSRPARDDFPELDPVDEGIKMGDVELTTDVPDSKKG